MKKNFLSILLFAAVLFTACGPETIVDETELPAKEAKRLVILSEGSLNHNNASLAMYDFTAQKLDNKFFETANNRGLGDTANDMIKYGSKIYVVVNVSSTVEVIDAKTGKSLKQISMKTADNKAKQPRNAAAYGGKVYVTSFDDTVTRIDTTSLAIDGSVQVGRDPEGICIKNNKIYVANSGGLDYSTGNFDYTVSVIDLHSFKEEKKIEVGKNPYQVFADSQGDIYVSTRDIYNSSDWTKIDVPASFKKINVSTGKVETIATISPNKFTIVNDKAYVLVNNYTKTIIAVYDCLNEKVVTNNLLSSDTEIAMPYSIAVDAFNEDVFVMDAIGDGSRGNIVCYDKSGKYKYKIEGVGLYPNNALFLN